MAEQLSFPSDQDDSATLASGAKTPDTLEGDSNVSRVQENAHKTELLEMHGDIAAPQEPSLETSDWKLTPEQRAAGKQGVDKARAALKEAYKRNPT